jgi:hypothetical protein
MSVPSTAPTAAVRHSSVWAEGGPTDVASHVSRQDEWIFFLMFFFQAFFLAILLQGHFVVGEGLGLLIRIFIRKIWP